MQLVMGRTKAQQYASRKEIARIFGYKNPSDLLKRFRVFADDNPNYFKPYTPYVKNTGMDTLYCIICFAFFFEYMDLVEAGTRSITFKNELERLKEVYG